MNQAGEFLLPQEIKRLASAEKLDEQEAFLKTQGIPHRRLGKRIVVSREHARAWLTGVVFTPSRGINLGAVR